MDSKELNEWNYIDIQKSSTRTVLLVARQAYVFQKINLENVKKKSVKTIWFLNNKMMKKKKKKHTASSESWTHDPWFTRPVLCHWAIEADLIMHANLSKDFIN